MEQKTPKMVFLTHAAKIALFYFVGLSLFLTTGFVIFKVLFAETEKVVVPDVVGRLYLNDHNLLRDDFKVEIKPAYLLQYPYGYILAQSLPAGREVEKNTKLELLVNFSDAVVQVPKLVGLSEDLVDGALASLPVGGRIFSLRRGMVTRVPSAKPQREVLAQFPPPGTPVIPNTPVALLISDGPKAQAAAPKLEKGIPVSLALAAAYHLRRPAKLVRREVPNADDNARLLRDAEVTGDSIAVEVGYFPEQLAKGKSAIALEDLPFTTVWLPAKKLGKRDAIFTIARREAVANEDGSFYSEFWLLYNTETIPVFRRRSEQLDVFVGHHVVPEVKTPEPQDGKSEGTTVVGPPEKKPSETPPPVEPIRRIKLQAESL